MKRYVRVLLAALMMPATVTANEVDPCLHDSEIAGMIMDLRQSENSMAQTMEAVKGNELHEKLTIIAYDQPAMRTPDNQKMAIKKFSNDVYLMCLKRMRQ